jgi:hypothetical protein
MMRTGRFLVFAALCEMAGKTSRYADTIRRRAERLEGWAADHRGKYCASDQLAEPQLDHT